MYCNSMLNFHPNRNTNKCIFHTWSHTPLNSALRFVVVAVIVFVVFVFEVPSGVMQSYTVSDNLPTVHSNTSHNSCGIFPHANVGYGEEEIKTCLRLIPQGDSSFVVMTNYIITEGQKLGKCPEVSYGVRHY